MITLIALRNFVLRPWRSLFLLLGYSLGVAVMIVLLSIGAALLVQARQERLVGGGQVTVLPEGIDVEVLKTGGLGGMFFSIDHARFIYRQLLAAPRLSSSIAAAAPQIDSIYRRRARSTIRHGGNGITSTCSLPTISAGRMCRSSSVASSRAAHGEGKYWLPCTSRADARGDSSLPRPRTTSSSRRRGPT